MLQLTWQIHLNNQKAFDYPKNPITLQVKQIEKLKLFFHSLFSRTFFFRDYRHTIYNLHFSHTSAKFTCSGGIEFPPLSRQHDHSWAVLPGRYLILGTNHSCPPGSGVGLQPVLKSHYFYSLLQKREIIEILCYKF